MVVTEGLRLVQGSQLRDRSVDPFMRDCGGVTGTGYCHHSHGTTAGDRPVILSLGPIARVSPRSFINNTSSGSSEVSAFIEYRILNDSL
jgi:hypothetical protein